MIRERRKYVSPHKVVPGEEDDPEEGSMGQGDFAIIKHSYDPRKDPLKSRPHDRIVGENEFIKLFEVYKPAQKDWQSIEYVQTTVKSRMGLGQHIPIHFRAELNKTSEDSLSVQYANPPWQSIIKQFPPVIKYDYNEIGREHFKSLDMKLPDAQSKIDSWLVENSIEDYCLRQILKMCTYISTVRKIEILSLKADFFMDTNDRVWLFDVRDIVWRGKKQSFADESQIASLKQKLEEQHKRIKF